MKWKENKISKSTLNQTLQQILASVFFFICLFLFFSSFMESTTKFMLLVTHHCDLMCLDFCKTWRIERDWSCEFLRDCNLCHCCWHCGGTVCVFWGVMIYLETWNALSGLVGSLKFNWEVKWKINKNSYRAFELGHYYLLPYRPMRWFR